MKSLIRRMAKVDCKTLWIISDNKNIWDAYKPPNRLYVMAHTFKPFLSKNFIVHIWQVVKSLFCINFADFHLILMETSYGLKSNCPCRWLLLEPYLSLMTPPICLDHHLSSGMAAFILSLKLAIASFTLQLTDDCRSYAPPALHQFSLLSVRDQ